MVIVGYEDTSKAAEFTLYMYAKAALQKGGSMEPMEPRLDPPLHGDIF